MPSDSPRSSATISDQGFVNHDLEREIAQDEKIFEAYGGDDPHEPAKDKNITPVEIEEDSNRVTWDGPHDPANPQNWSMSYKWLITALCCLMTANTYVLPCYIAATFS
jgi:hypothetical protein